MLNEFINYNYGARFSLVEQPSGAFSDMWDPLRPGTGAQMTAHWEARDHVLLPIPQPPRQAELNFTSPTLP